MKCVPDVGVSSVCRNALIVGLKLLLGSSTATPLSPTPSPPTYRDRAEALTGISLRVCPVCHHGEMIIIDRLVPARRAMLLNPATS